MFEDSGMNISWSELTMYYVAGNLVIMFLFTITAAIGGAFDLKYMFRELRQKTVDETDDGRVIQTEMKNDEPEK